MYIKQNIFFKKSSTSKNRVFWSVMYCPNSVASNINDRAMPVFSGSQVSPVSSTSENATQVHVSKNKVQFSQSLWIRINIYMAELWERKPNWALRQSTPRANLRARAPRRWLGGEPGEARLSEGRSATPLPTRSVISHVAPMQTGAETNSVAHKAWQIPSAAHVSHPNPHNRDSMVQKAFFIYLFFFYSFPSLHAWTNSWGNYSNKSISKPDQLILWWGHFFI